MQVCLSMLSNILVRTISNYQTINWQSFIFMFWVAMAFRYVFNNIIENVTEIKP